VQIALTSVMVSAGIPPVGSQAGGIAGSLASAAEAGDMLSLLL
jgi:hypothetical protein